MKITGTKKAFLKMVSKRGIYKELGVDRSTVSNWKRALKCKTNNYSTSTDKMEQMLLIGGAKVVSDKIWDVKV